MKNISVEASTRPQLFQDLPSVLLLDTISQWIGLREILQENSIFTGKIDGFL
jgi:hypothetical protein